MARRELPEIFIKALENPENFRSFMAEVDLRLRELVQSAESGAVHDANLLRSLHTLKGNTSTYGFDNFAREIHALEQSASETPIGREQLIALEQLWEESSGPARGMIIDDPGRELYVDQTDLEALWRELEAGASASDIRRTTATWLRTPTRLALAQLERQSRRLGNTLGKKLVVEIADGRERWPREDYEAFVAVLIHVLRNAIDHGIETPEERLASGKTRAGRITLTTRTTMRPSADQPALLLTIGDDGRGIDWARIRTRAESLGWTPTQPNELISALFADGVTTRDKVSIVSGRGVGLSATLAQCQACGIDIEVESTQGQGTEFRFWIPMVASNEASPPRAKPVAA